ncbi:hypothetical protein [Haloplasma contractile]|uniref:DUF6199 domain-containing protein n=1 Tax=Haloplasma contractile SSD-17B TaxID=1033810 RepID=F7PVG8_9MOLU|nr:hypothetical protein [Haloplasma contractile]ERJ12864.1 hypothetical protein HLPCO_001204 [Haloplasma contractile SSD-17B]
MHIVFGLFFIIIGFLNVSIPEQMIKIRHFWTFKNGRKLSSLELVTARVGGAILIIFGIVLFFKPFN